MRTKNSFFLFSAMMLSIKDAPAWPVIPHFSSENLDISLIALLVLGLILLIGILFLCLWGFRKGKKIQAGGERNLRVIECLSLGFWEKVLLLQAGRKRLLVAVTPGRIQTLSVFESEEDLQVTEQRKTARISENQADTEIKPRANKVQPERFTQAVFPELPSNAVDTLSRSRETPGYEKNLAYVQSLVDENPKLVAQTLKAWIRNE